MSKFESSLYKNVSIDPVPTGRGSVGFLGAHFGTAAFVQVAGFCGCNNESLVHVR